MIKWRGFLLVGQHESTSSGVGHVVMTATAVVNAVLTASRRVPLKAQELVCQPLDAEQPDLARIDHRQ